jgi:outer membrane protein insertion porin family
MRRQLLYILLLMGIGAMVSCSVEKHLPPGTQLYKGAEFTIVKDSANKTSEKTIKKQLAAIGAPKPNKKILGFPYRVWLWYAIGEPKKETGLKHWLRYRIGEEPVLNTTINVKANADNFANYLVNKGYFDSKTTGDTTIKNYWVEANYKVNLGMPYYVNNFSWIIDSTAEIAKAIKRIPSQDIAIKKGEQFDLDKVKAERIRVDLALKNRGFYYFSPEHIKAWVDSSSHNYTVDVFFKLKDETPVAAVIPQRINSITIFPNYSLLIPPPDTSKTGMDVYNGIYIRDTVHNMNYPSLTRSVTYRRGSLYRTSAQNRTLSRFVNTGVFKFVKNRYEVVGDTIIPRWLDVYYYLTPMPKKNIQGDIGAFIKSNSYTGAQASLTWKNRNAFKGGEQLAFKIYGSFEASSTDSLNKNNNFRLGGELSLTFPRFVAPFKIRDSFSFPPKTTITLGYEWMRKQALYTKGYTRLQYDFTWRESVNKTHRFAPVSITYNSTSAYSPEYKVLVDLVPPLKVANLPELIFGSFYNYTWHTRNTRGRNVFYFSGNLDAAGNIIGLFNKVSDPFTGKIANAYFAQYVKADVDLRYSMKLGENLHWVNRLVVGAGFPYNNSNYLPFTKQFIIGGANSLRGFEVRELGPGRVKTTVLQQYYYPQIGGDYKLELNTELRFPLFGKLNGATFIDAGNVWSKDTFLYGQEAVFTNQFLKDIAIDAGLGARLDITFLVVRFDVGFPLRIPYNEPGKEWNFGNALKHPVYNIAIGYPF